MACRVHIVETEGEVPLSVDCDLNGASTFMFVVSQVFLVSCLDFVVIVIIICVKMTVILVFPFHLCWH